MEKNFSRKPNSLKFIFYNRTHVFSTSKLSKAICHGEQYRLMASTRNWTALNKKETRRKLYIYATLSHAFNNKLRTREYAKYGLLKPAELNNLLGSSHFYFSACWQISWESDRIYFRNIRVSCVSVRKLGTCEHTFDVGVRLITLSPFLPHTPYFKRCLRSCFKTLKANLNGWIQ